MQKFQNISNNNKTNSKFFAALIDNELFFHYLTIFILILGVWASLSLTKEARPNVNFNVISISVTYPSSTPQDVERLVIKPIEEKLDEISGIKKYQSSSFSGLGTVSIQIDPDYKEKDKIIDEIRRLVEQIDNFPDNVETPIIKEVKAEHIPILILAISGGKETNYLNLRQAADLLKDKIRKVAGVSDIMMEGYYDLQFVLNSKLADLDKNLISVEQIINIIKSYNISSPAGQVIDNNKEYNIKISEELKDIDIIKNIPLRVNDQNYLVKIDDIAEVSLGVADNNIRKIYNTVPAITLIITRKMGFDTINTVNQIKEITSSYQQQQDNIKVNDIFDDSTYIRSRLEVITNNIILGLILVSLILLCTLNFRVSIVTIIGLIVAFLGGLIFLWALDMSINVLTVLGMIIVLGMLVDDAIVISENICFYIEKGYPIKDAAIKGVQNIYKPVITAIFTTIIAFLPLVFMKGIIGQFLSVIPIVVIIMLSFSLLEAIFILPIHAKALLKPIKNDNIFSKVNKYYQKYLLWSIRHLKYVLGLFVIYAIATIFIAKSQLSFTLFPSSGIEEANITIEAQENNILAVTEEITKKLGADILAEVGTDIIAINSTIGQAVVDFITNTKKKGTNYAFLEVKFTSDSSFADREKTVMTKIRNIVDDYIKKYNLTDASVEIIRDGPPVGREIEFLIYGKDFVVSEQVAAKLQKIITNKKGVKNISSDLEAQKKQYRIIFDKININQQGLDLNKIAQIIFTLFGEVPISTTRVGDDEIDIIMKLSDLEKNLTSLKKIKILNKNNHYIPLSSVINIVETKSRNVIYRVDGKKTISIYGNVDSEITSSKRINKQLIPDIKKLQQEFPNTIIETAGEEKERIAALKDVGKLYIIAIIGIFMIISLNLHSVILPFIVMLVIPFAVGGVVWALFLHNAPISMMGIIGAIGMSGVAVNGSIILIRSIIDALPKHNPYIGLTKRNLIALIINCAVRRFRPITLTTITTLIGLIPTIYGFGGNDSLVQPMVLVLGWGLFFATIFILLFLPVILVKFFLLCQSFNNKKLAKN